MWIIFVLNLGWYYSPHILVNTFLHGQERGCSKVNMWRGMGGIVILARWEKHLIRVSHNIYVFYVHLNRDDYFQWKPKGFEMQTNKIKLCKVVSFFFL